MISHPDPSLSKLFVNHVGSAGPSFLWNDVLHELEILPINPELPETVVESTALMTSYPDSTNPIIEASRRVSSLTNLINVTKLVRNFIISLAERVQLRRGVNVVSCPKTTNEEALRLIIIATQRFGFYRSSPPDGALHSKSLVNLAPFYDDSVLRVGGRLKRSELSVSTKHPILLPDCSPITRLIVSHFHSLTRHQGRVITMSAIRQAGYFIQHGSGVIKKFINSCITCRRLRRNPLTQRMTDLPCDRLEATPPFTYCGIDVFGPFCTADRISTRRSASSRKMWGLLFICLASKAVHIEPLVAMDTSSFKNALRRFFCVRGVCRKLRSDRGTNFIGAFNQDAEVVSLKILQEEASRHNCEWEFNPPHSSHFGGIWERAIRSIRNILDACLLSLTKRPPTGDELHTFFQEATSIVNNTPMYSISSDPCDELPLTPSRLITLKNDADPPPLEQFSDADLLAYGSRRWRRVQALSNCFWRRWREEYLQTLQKRQKWTKDRPNLEVGDVVLLKTKGVRRNHWPLGRVHSVKTSSDGRVRSATLTVPSGKSKMDLKLFQRPISEIVTLIRANGDGASE